MSEVAFYDTCVFILSLNESHRECLACQALLDVAAKMSPPVIMDYDHALGFQVSTPENTIQPPTRLWIDTRQFVELHTAGRSFLMDQVEPRPTK